MKLEENSTVLVETIAKQKLVKAEPHPAPRNGLPDVVATNPAISFPMEQRVRQREKKKSGHVAKRRPQVVEDHHDDCGEDFSPLGDDFFSNTYFDITDESYLDV